MLQKGTRILVIKRFVLLLSPFLLLFLFQQSWISRPVKKLKVRGAIYETTAVAVHDALKDDLGTGFFSLDLPDIQSHVLTIPWVRHAQVKRQWPEQLVIEIQEHRPFARLGSGGIITVSGQRIYEPYPGHDPIPLQLNSPPGQEMRVLAQYAGFDRQLKSVGLNISKLSLASRGAWEVTLSDGMVIRLGRSEVNARLQRFLNVYVTHLSADAQKIAYVDLRYTEGFAIKWR